MSEEPMNNKIVNNDAIEGRVENCVFCNLIAANGSNILEPRVRHYKYSFINFIIVYYLFRFIIKYEH